MTTVKHLIAFWEAKLLHDKFLMEPSVVVIIEDTIAALKELQESREGIL